MIVNQYFRYANGTVAKFQDVDVRDRNTLVLATTVTTDQYGLATVDLPNGEYEWSVFGYQIPFDVNDPDAPVAAPPFVHEQVAPSALWIIPHMRGWKPPVTVFLDTEPDVPVYPGVEHPDLDHVHLEMPTPVTGKAYIP